MSKIVLKFLKNIPKSRYNNQGVHMKLINGQTELDYLTGALTVLRTELATSHNPVEVMERIQNVKDCIIRLVTNVGSN
jgi:hypothetical protein